MKRKPEEKKAGDDESAARRGKKPSATKAKPQKGARERSAAAKKPAGKKTADKKPAGKKSAGKKAPDKVLKSAAKKSREVLAVRQQELAAELIQLRANFVDIINRYRANQEAQLLSCIESLAAAAAPDHETRPHAEEEIVALLDELRQLRIKPEKGRLKDVRRIDILIDKVYRRLLASS